MAATCFPYGFPTTHSRVDPAIGRPWLLLSDNHHGRLRQPSWPVGLKGRRACPSSSAQRLRPEHRPAFAPTAKSAVTRR